MQGESSATPKEGKDDTSKAAEDDGDESDGEPLPLTEEDKLYELMKKAKEEAMEELNSNFDKSRKRKMQREDL